MIAVLAALLIAAVPPPYTAKVVGITDGDTLTVLTAQKQQVKIRLNGVDAPESAQDWGQRSKQATSALVFGKEVVIHPRDTDRYGRTVAEVKLPDGRSLNEELVRGGNAWWYEKYAPQDKVLAELQAEAKAAKRGLWSQPRPIPPWEFRKGATADGPATAWVGNRSSKVYHKPGCPNGAKIGAKNRVEFATAEEAQKAGMRPGGDCHR